MLRRFEYKRIGWGGSKESAQTKEIMPCYEGIKKINTCQLFLFNSAKLFFNAIVSGNRSGLACICFCAETSVNISRNVDLHTHFYSTS